MKKNNLIKIGALFISALALHSCSDDNETDTPSEGNYSPYISKVFDFMPSVGQFTNVLPAFTAGDTKETMIKKAEKALVGDKTSMVSLGGYGGYIVFGFDHTIENKLGLCDFRVKGNAFMAESNPNPNGGEGGSCEPGIIMVSYDANKNGLPDDEWYEIAGSAYEQSIKNYEITYYKPSAEKTQVKGPLDWQTDVEYIRWTDNQGGSGYTTKNSFHDQNYFPEWINGDKITFKGTKLPNNAVNEGTELEQFWVLYAFGWGYADNYPNSEDKSAIDIDWAVDKNGNKVNLKGIDFVKLYTGVHQEAGWIGEVSTEITGAEDLHLLRKVIPSTIK